MPLDADLNTVHSGSFTLEMDQSETSQSRTPLADRTNTIIQGGLDQIDQLERSQRRTPLADRTNTIIHGELDPNARKRLRDKERYASMSREKKDELNRKRRERRQAQKELDDENAPNDEGDHRPPSVGRPWMPPSSTSRSHQQ